MQSDQPIYCSFLDTYNQKLYYANPANLMRNRSPTRTVRRLYTKMDHGHLMLYFSKMCNMCSKVSFLNVCLLTFSLQ